MFQDSVFMMPHLGVLSTVYREAAWEIFDKDCLIRLGTVIAPKGSTKYGENVMSVTLEMPNGEIVTESLQFGEMKRLSLQVGKEARVKVEPSRGFDVGQGTGNKFEGSVMGGEVGIVLDARGRPLQIPEDEATRRSSITKWFQTLGVYPEAGLGKSSQ